MSYSFCTLVVDDEELYAHSIARELGRQGVRCDLAFTGRAALEQASRGCYQAILLDHRLPDEDGIELIPLLLARQSGAAVLVMTAFHAIPHAVQAIRRGAEDYIVKETSLRPIVDRVLELRRRDEARRAMPPVPVQERDGPTACSAAMRQVLEQLHKAAESPETTVLLTGETGAGKEVAARYLHRLTYPAGRPMVAVDCVALPHALAESLLFGHVKGAFTGADEARAGAFEEARDGTIFLDEVGDMGALQSKLLRVLESRAFCRVGSVKEIPLRARVVAGTNRDLGRLLDAGGFRLDLYQRLSGFPIHIPPLRERHDDIIPLAEHFRAFFAEKLGKAIAPLGAEVRARLLAYSYPGNVRELKHVIERAVIMTDCAAIELRQLPQRVLSEPRTAPEASPGVPLDFVPGIDTLDALEKRMITRAMRRAGNVKAEAARLLGISRYQLLRRLAKYKSSR
ncbi:MAG: sigma-54-dependent Fis family transcriptional regulator [Deltaproteobacteria bacterium]|nr:sigma-54-dependent Fis family transcriptional regulator [Deltaproteobacteria bacterium]